jgi:hypothetical protein
VAVVAHTIVHQEQVRLVQAVLVLVVGLVVVLVMAQTQHLTQAQVAVVVVLIQQHLLLVVQAVQD